MINKIAKANTDGRGKKLVTVFAFVLSHIPGEVVGPHPDPLICT